VDRETSSPRTADAWLISREILLLAARGTTRTAYFRDALWLILDLSGESVVELWMREGGEYRFFRAARSKGGKFEFESGLAGEAPGGGPDGSTAGATVREGFLVVPITDGTTEQVGHLRIRAEDDAGPRDVELFEALADALGIGILSRDVQSALRERVKELTCLYGISSIAEQPGKSLEEVLQGIVDLLPPAWQYPGIASARIVVDGKTFATSNLGDIVNRQSSPIVIDNRNRGVVEVIYSAQKPVIDEGPFLEEERSLLDVIANQVALIIERRSAEEDRARLEEQLRHADRLATLGQLAAGVAHELNEPLGNVLGFAQLASKHGPLDPLVQEDLDKIVNASLFARDVIKKLMLFARQTPPNKTEVDLNKVVSDGLALLGGRCTKQGIDVENRLASDLPLITADEGQVNQVLVNLVVNAIHAMPGGGSLCIDTESIDGSVLLRVRDTGVGMSEDVLEKIFLPFYTTKDVDEGTGLGLAVVNGIVTSHGGFIKVESAPGEGSTFEVSIPVTGSQAAEGSER
jgi:signal transduction histidine kinase